MFERQKKIDNLSLAYLRQVVNIFKSPKMLENMLGCYIVDDCPMDGSNVILPSMTINQDSKTPYTDATQVSLQIYHRMTKNCK